MFKKTRIKNGNNFFKEYAFFRRVIKKLDFNVSENPSKLI